MGIILEFILMIFEYLQELVSHDHMAMGTHSIQISCTSAIPKASMQPCNKLVVGVIQKVLNGRRWVGVHYFCDKLLQKI